MGDSRGIRILVVDDDQSMVSTLRDILMATGHDVEVAYSGTEAIERVGEVLPDCILMDIRMPGPNGVEAFQEIKRISPHSFVIFMTAYSDSALVEKAHTEGAVEVLPKPLDLERLLRLIQSTWTSTAASLAGPRSWTCASTTGTPGSRRSRGCAS